MRYWKFSQKTKLKQNFFANSEKEVGNFFQDWDHSDYSKLSLSHTCWVFVQGILTSPDTSFPR